MVNFEQKKREICVFGKEKFVFTEMEFFFRLKLFKLCQWFLARLWKKEKRGKGKNGKGQGKKERKEREKQKREKCDEFDINWTLLQKEREGEREKKKKKMQNLEFKIWGEEGEKINTWKAKEKKEKKGREKERGRESK